MSRSAAASPRHRKTAPTPISTRSPRSISTKTSIRFASPAKCASCMRSSRWQYPAWADRYPRGKAMIGWRARLGFLVPPGNPTVEPEMAALAPDGVSLHFNRMIARGAPGSPEGQSERNQTMLDNIDDCVEMLALVKPDVIVLAHT